MPSEIFRRTLEMVRAHTTLGLTATLVREDDLIKDLSFLLGPKLYEANWMDLTARGYLAKVLCSEVWCPMTTNFTQPIWSLALMQEYSAPLATADICVEPKQSSSLSKVGGCAQAWRQNLSIFLMIFLHSRYAELLQVPMLYGDTPAADRLQIIAGFKTSPVQNVICISSVGDTSIDLPECAVIIQVASHFGARRQEAQRLGSVAQRQGPSCRGLQCVFLLLVSTETREMCFAHRRQRYLQDQGYTYK